MHELGVLCEAVKMVNGIAEKNRISRVKHITLEVGKDSGYVPAFFEKLFPVAIDPLPLLAGSELKILMAEGKGLIVKEIGY